MKAFIRKCLDTADMRDILSRVLPLVPYAAFYIAFFIYLEHRPVEDYHIIHLNIDDKIPFLEFFVIPYYLWFAYIAATVVLFVFLKKSDYLRFVGVMLTGMTVFLAVSYFFPNMQPLRPGTFARDNIFVDLVRQLYSTDTCTNVVPSIHVFNSLVACNAINKAKELSAYRTLRICSDVLCISIILSTMFIKQHSMFDVLTATVMAVVLCYLVYELPEAREAAQAIPAKASKERKHIIL